MSRTVRLVPNKIYSYDETRFGIENESNMFTNVDSDTYARITGSTNYNGKIFVSGFDFSQVPSSAIVTSYSLKIKISSSANAQLSTREYLYNKTSVIAYVSQISINLYPNPYISSIANPMPWAELVDIGDDLCFGIPGRGNAYTDVYGVEIEVTYDLPVNKVVYGTTVLVDLTADTVTPETLMQGYTAHDKSGALITGTNTGGGSNDFVITLSYNESTEMWEPGCTYAEVAAAYQAGKSIIVDTNANAETVTADGLWRTSDNTFFYVTHQYSSGELGATIYETGYVFAESGLSKEFQGPYYETSAGSITLTENHTTYDVKYYSSAIVNVPSSAPTLQSKSVSYAPSETAQSDTVTPDNGYDGLSGVGVSIGAIPSTYVGTSIPGRESLDLIVSGNTVTVPSGYYSAQASKSVASGTAGTPTATKGTVSNHSISVTPSVTNATGYITGGTKTGTAVTVSASELVSGSETKTANGTYDVTNLASLVVAIPFITYHTSSSDPTSSQGSNGDIWLVTE